MSKQKIMQIFRIIGEKIKKGRLNVYYKGTDSKYLSMPFTKLQYDGTNLAVKYMDSSYEGAKFTIHSSDVVNVDLGESDKEGKIIFETDRFDMVMAVS